MLRAARFLRSYLRPGATAAAERDEEIVFRVEGEDRDATLFLPETRRPAPGFVVLHGLTVPGRHHTSLRRFAQSMAAAGAVVMVPDVPAWRELRIDTKAAGETIAAALRHVASLPQVRPDGVGVVGFSFGATQALITAADPSLHGVLRGVVGFGGYCDLGRSVRSMMTGEHEWNGVHERLDPDPYGRWIIVGNYLTRVPGYEHMEAVRAAAHELAVEAGRLGKYAGDADYDPLKATIRARLSPDEQRIWDSVAPPAGQGPADVDFARRLAADFAAAALDMDPGLDPRPHLPHVRARVVLAHGLEDRLVPYTESLRLFERLPPATRPTVTITRLFAHSTHGTGMGPLAYAREGWRFLRLLDRALNAV
jgi:pimeloyl-ACP methyl ester carboxylesterase